LRDRLVPSGPADLDELVRLAEAFQAAKYPGKLCGTALSVLTVAAFTFGANLLHLVGTPGSTGQTWDVAVAFQFGA
jgi:hypothetical protein